MTDADARQLIQRYSRSYFLEDTAEGWFEAHKAGNYISSRAIGGSKVPIAKDRELVAALIENVEQARLAVRDTGATLALARRDGLLDKEAFSSLSKKMKVLWLGAVQIVKGDYQRALAEMKHWQGYAELASEGKLPVLSKPAGLGEIVRQLADAKSIEPDRRLPPEAE